MWFRTFGFGIFGAGSLVRALWLRVLDLGSLAWDLPFGIFGLRSFVRDKSFGIHRLGSLAWDLWLAIFRLGPRVGIFGLE